VKRKRLVRREQLQQAREVRHVSGDKQVAILGANLIQNPRGRIVGLQISRRAERRQRIASTPQRFSRLPGAQLAAVPHHFGPRAARGGFGRKPRDLALTPFRQRAPAVDFRTDRVTVMDEKQLRGNTPPMAL